MTSGMRPVRHGRPRQSRGHHRHVAPGPVGPRARPGNRKTRPVEDTAPHRKGSQQAHFKQAAWRRGKATEAAAARGVPGTSNDTELKTLKKLQAFAKLLEFRIIASAGGGGGARGPWRPRPSQHRGARTSRALNMGGGAPPPHGPTPRPATSPHPPHARTHARTRERTPLRPPAARTRGKKHACGRPLHGRTKERRRRVARRCMGDAGSAESIQGGRSSAGLSAGIPAGRRRARASSVR
jgi:hypothetical protein